MLDDAPASVFCSLLALNDRALRLAGPLPAALLAFASEAVFELLERRLRPQP